MKMITTQLSASGRDRQIYKCQHNVMNAVIDAQTILGKTDAHRHSWRRLFRGEPDCRGYSKCLLEEKYSKMEGSMCSSGFAELKVCGMGDGLVQVSRLRTLHSVSWCVSHNIPQFSLFIITHQTHSITLKFIFAMSQFSYRKMGMIILIFSPTANA